MKSTCTTSLLIFFFILLGYIQFLNGSEKEYDLKTIELSGHITSPEAEISGLAWYGDKLILLPQYPHRFYSVDNQHIFYISKDRLMNYVNGLNTNKIEPKEIDFHAPNLQKLLNGFEGYEAICFSGDTVFITIEVENKFGVKSFIIKGKIDTAVSVLTLDENSLTQLPSEINLPNMAHETLTIYNDKIIAIYEANGKNVNTFPEAQICDFNLNTTSKIDFPNIEYRITDATKVDENGFFWVINYFYPGDEKILKPLFDCSTSQEKYKTQKKTSTAVERLLKLKIENQKIILVGNEQIYIKPDTLKNSRNWEGLAKLNSDGFLIITDKFPETILAFLPFRDVDKLKLIVFEDNGKYGYKNNKDEIVIQPQFNMAMDFNSCGIAAVVDDSGWVYINQTGVKIIRPYVVDNGPDYFSDGLARYVENDKIGFFDESGKVIIKARFDFARPFADSTAAVCRGCWFINDGEYKRIIDGKWGFIDYEGELIFPVKFDVVEDFKNGSARVKENGKIKFIYK